jgi:hypothetical protein
MDFSGVRQLFACGVQNGRCRSFTLVTDAKVKLTDEKWIFTVAIVF